MKRRPLIIFFFSLLTMTFYGQSNFDFIVNLEYSSFNIRKNCLYTVNYQDGAVKTLSFSQLMSNLQNDTLFCSSLREIEVKRPDLEGIYAPRKIEKCKDLSDNKPIVLDCQYTASNNNGLEAKYSLGFDGYKPEELEQIVLFDVNNKYTRALEALKDSISRDCFGSNKLALNLSVSAAAVPTLAEYRQVKSDTVYCKLLFNPAKLEDFFKDRWILLGVLFHEFEHLVGQHGVRTKDSEYEDELDADFSAGYQLYDFTKDTSLVVRMLSLVNDTIINPYYPEKKVRRQYILKDWAYKDSIVKAQNKIIFDNNILLINGLARSLESLRVGYADGKIKGDTLQNRMNEIKKKIDTIDCSACSVELDKLKASYYFNSGMFNNNKKDFNKAAYHYNLLIEKKLDFYFKSGEANFYATAYEFALESFLKTDTTKFKRNELASLHFMEGISYFEEKDLQNALNYLTLSINLGISRSDAYEKRAEIRQALFPDSVISAIDDYYQMLKLVADSGEILKINKKIASLSDKAYKAAVSGKAQNPELSANTLIYLSRQPNNLKYTDVQYQISDCFMVLYNNLLKNNYLDSIIWYASQQIYLSPKDSNYNAKVLRGKAFFLKSTTGDFEKESNAALFDLRRIPEAEKELYGEASYYTIRILIHKDEKNDKYCDIHRIFSSVRNNYWIEQITPFICENYKNLDNRDCMNFKQRRAIRKMCKL